MRLTKQAVGLAGELRGGEQRAELVILQGGGDRLVAGTGAETEEGLAAARLERLLESGKIEG